MNSACTCHVSTETCWWCLYQIEKEKVKDFERLYHIYLDKYTKMVGIKNELIQLANDFKNGHVGEITDSFLVDEMLEILNR